jgi:MFS_1 like family
MPSSGQMRRARRALDAANFFLADVRDGLGPYLAIYLLTVQKWDEASIGVVMSIATAAGLAAQTPAGVVVDATRAKRALIAAAALLVTVLSLLLRWLPTFLPVALTQATAHAAAAVFARHSRRASAATNRSTTPAMLLRRRWPARRPICGDHRWSSICSPPCRS